VAMDVDGAPGLGFAGAQGRTAVIGRWPANFALEQHGLVLDHSVGTGFGGGTGESERRRECRQVRFMPAWFTPLAGFVSSHALISVVTMLAGLLPAGQAARMHA
jgi:hypothetical protein